jgi:hypothetical protein
MRNRLVLAALLVAAPAHGEVTASNEHGFISHNEVLVDGAPGKAWAEMLAPGGWWSGEHTYSGNASNMTLEPVVGGCFCEAIPATVGAPAGQVEHMRVLYSAPYSTLRMRGSLGPLQSEAVTGVLTMTLKPEGRMTRIAWDYVVGGYMRMPLAATASAVDQVLGEQLIRLSTRLGRVVDPTARRP